MGSGRRGPHFLLGPFLSLAIMFSLFSYGIYVLDNTAVKYIDARNDVCGCEMKGEELPSCDNITKYEVVRIWRCSNASHPSTAQHPSTEAGRRGGDGRGAYLTAELGVGDDR